MEMALQEAVKLSSEHNRKKNYNYGNGNISQKYVNI